MLQNTVKSTENQCKQNLIYINIKPAKPIFPQLHKIGKTGSKPWYNWDWG